MAINKNFVIKNGAEISTKLFVADATNQRVGVGTTVPTYTLHVFGPNEQPGSIGATVLNVTGVTTTILLNVAAAATFSNGPVFVGTGTSTGTPLQPLQVGTATTVKGVYISGDVGIGNTFPGAKLQVVPESTRIAGLFSGTTSADLVRLTQLGSGNALVVEDEANPDATAFVISGLGSVGIGTNVPRYLLDIDGTKFASEGLAVGQTAVYIRGDVKIVGDLSADDFTFDQAVHVYLNTSGFGTITSLLVPNTASISVGIITNIQGGNLTLAGVSTGINAPGISTLGFVQHTTLNVTGFSTLGSASAGNVTLAGIATGINAPGISTFGDTTISDLFLAGITTGLNASGISTLTSLTGTSANFSGISTLAFVQHTTLNVSGFSTLGSVNAANLGLAGITTGINAPGISTFGDITVSDLFIAGITTGLNASGISTLTSLTGTNVNYSGIGTIANLRSTNANVTGITTTDSLVVNSAFNVYSADATFYNNVTINGNLSIGGTSTVINAAQLRVEDKDIVLGFTTSQLPTDDTANHGGIAIASTEGYPLVPLSVAGINTLPDTYKQIMWMKRDTMGAGTTDAFLFNYGVGIGSTQVPNGIRLAVGAVQISEDTVNARVGNLTHLRSTNINATGITTTNSLSIDATQVISSARQLQNIASLDAVTTATIEAAIVNAPNSFTDLTVTGFSTLAAVSAGNLVLAGITTGLNVPGIGTVGFIQHTTLNVSGFSTLGSVNAANLGLAGITTGLNVPGISTLTSVTGASANFSGISTLASITSTNVNITGITTIAGGLNVSQGADLARLRVTGITTLGQANITGLSNAGVSTLGNATASTLVVSGVSTIGFATASNLTVTGVVTAFGGLQGIGIQTNGVNVTTGIITALNFVGTGNTITYDAPTKTVSINIAGSAGGGGGSGVTEIKTSGISTTNPIGVGSFATASFRSASVVAQINQNAQYQVGRYLMIHDGTTVTVVEEGAVSTGSSMIGSFTGAIVGSNAELRVSLALPQSTAGVATVTTKIDTITI